MQILGRTLQSYFWEVKHLIALKASEKTWVEAMKLLIYGHSNNKTVEIEAKLEVESNVSLFAPLARMPKYRVMFV